MVMKKDCVFSKNKLINFSIISFIFSIFITSIDSLLFIFEFFSRLFTIIFDVIYIFTFSINNFNNSYIYGNKD